MAKLPVIEDSREAKLRAPQEIAERFVACAICAIAGESGDRKLVEQLLKDYSAQPLLSPKEKKFLSESLEDRQERTQFSWRYERAWVLLWALGYVDDLTYPKSICDVPRLASILRGKTVSQLVAGAKPRPIGEVLDTADLIYRLDWAVVDARVNKRFPPPKDVDSGVVVERHAALNWLIGYMGQIWDDISTDT